MSEIRFCIITVKEILKFSFLRFSVGWSKDLQKNLGSLGVETIFNSRSSELKGIGADDNLSVGGFFHNAHLTIEEFGNKENETKNCEKKKFKIITISKK